MQPRDRRNAERLIIMRDYARGKYRDSMHVSSSTYRHDRIGIKEGYSAVSSINRSSTVFQALPSFSHLLDELQHEVHRSRRSARSRQRSFGETFGNGIVGTGKGRIVGGGS